MSKQERASWIGLIVKALIGGWYVGRVLSAPADTDDFRPYLNTFVWGIVAAGILGEILLRTIQRRTGGGTDAVGRDERDALISLKAVRNACCVLVVALTGVAVLLDSAQHHRLHPGDPDTVLELLAAGPLQPMHAIQLLCMAALLGGLTLDASRVFYYRRGH